VEYVLQTLDIHRTAMTVKVCSEQIYIKLNIQYTVILIIKLEANPYYNNCFNWLYFVYSLFCLETDVSQVYQNILKNVLVNMHSIINSQENMPCMALNI